MNQSPRQNSKDSVCSHHSHRTMLPPQTPATKKLTTISLTSAPATIPVPCCPLTQNSIFQLRLSPGQSQGRAWPHTPTREEHRLKDDASRQLPSQAAVRRPSGQSPPAVWACLAPPGWSAPSVRAPEPTGGLRHPPGHLRSRAGLCSTTQPSPRCLFAPPRRDVRPPVC